MNQNNPIDVLYKEHELISKAEDVILKLNNTWIDHPVQFEATVDKLLTFFQEYADGLHHRKEEEVLFPALMDNPQFTLHEIIREFENHHEEFRSYVGNIQEAISKKHYEQAYKLLRSYSMDLRDHIAAENEELFVLAENLLDDSEKEKMFFLFKDIDMEAGENHLKKLAEILNS